MLETNAYGRVASDVPIKTSKDKKHLYTTFLLATHSRKETTFVRCVAFDAMATLLHEYFTKGDRILIKGEFISDDYKGKKFTYKLKVYGFEFVETREEHEKNVKKHPRKEGKDGQRNSKDSGRNKGKNE